MIRLRRICFPSPHVTEHGDHVDHGLMWQFWIAEIDATL